MHLSSAESRCKGRAHTLAELATPRAHTRREFKAGETDMRRCVSLIGHCDKASQSGWLRTTESVSQFWRLEVHGQGVGRVDFL